MPGIADVQPKQISIPGISVQAVPAATPNYVALMEDQLRKNQITAAEVADRYQQMQLRNEELTPQAVQARQEARKASIQQSQAQQQTALTKDFVSAYLRYNLPLTHDDGTPDYQGMAEIGQKYADQERMLKYAEMGVTGKPVQTLDKNGNTITTYYNAFNEDVTPPPAGQKNTILENYQKMLQKARSYLLKNDDEPEIPEGETRKIAVEPRAVKELFKITDEPAGTMRTVVPEVPQYVPEGAVVQPVEGAEQARSWLAARKLIPTADTPAISDQEAVAAFTAYQNQPVQPVQPVAPVTEVTPKVAPATPDAPANIYVPGTGVMTAAGVKGDDIVKDMRAQELYRNWAEKSGTIERFRQAASSYKPGENVTAQKDIALATAITQMMTPSASGGMRGMQEMRPKALEEAEYLLYKVKDLPGHLLKAHYFSPETRKMLITEGERAARSLENVAKGPVKVTYDRLRQMGQDPAKYLDPTEMKLFGAGNTPAASSGGTVTVGGRNFQWSQ